MEVKGDGSEDIEKMIPYMKYHTVFNLEQCENIHVPAENPEVILIEECEQVIERMPNRPQIVHGGDKACYIPTKDIVRLPHKEAFKSIEEYHSTAFHELKNNLYNINRML